MGHEIWKNLPCHAPVLHCAQPRDLGAHGRVRTVPHTGGCDSGNPVLEGNVVSRAVPGDGIHSYDRLFRSSDACHCCRIRRVTQRIRFDLVCT